MNLPNRRGLAAITLIIAGIGAFMVPFLLHSPTPQGSSNSNGGGGTTTTTTTTNNNGGGHTSTTTTNPTTGTTNRGGSNDESGSSGGTTSGTATCDEDNSPDPSHTNNGKHKGQAKTHHSMNDDLDAAVAVVKALGTENPAFHSMHLTKTDNQTIHSHDVEAQVSHHAENGCAEDEEDSDE